MSRDNPATAEGDLQRTPFPHLLVYMAERRLSGTLFLKEPSGTEHVVRFHWGAPVLVRADDGFARFGELLVEAGVVPQHVVDKALTTKGLLGDVLILTGHADGDTLERVAVEQLKRRIVRLFGLPHATTFRYFDGELAKADVPGPGSRGDVLQLLAVGVRTHPRAALPLARLLEKLGDVPLMLHPDAVTDRFDFNEDETKVVTTILAGRPTLVDLVAASVVDPDVVRRVAYLLLLTRQIDLGAHLTPLGSGELPPPVALGRVVLRAAVHRVGAAAPDPVGDGERAAVLPRTLRRRRNALVADGAAAAGLEGGNDSPESSTELPPAEEPIGAGCDSELTVANQVAGSTAAPEPCPDSGLSMVESASGPSLKLHEIDEEMRDSGIVEPISEVIEIPGGLRAQDTGTNGKRDSR